MKENKLNDLAVFLDDQIKKLNKLKHGGKRPNSGRKKGIETTTMRVPLCLKEIIQRYVKRAYAKQRTQEELLKEKTK